MGTPLLPDLLMTEFAERLLKLRKDKGLTQQALADLAGLHVVQVSRYETNASQPSLEAIQKLAIALSVSADALLLDEDERGPSDALARVRGGQPFSTGRAARGDGGPGGPHRQVPGPAVVDRQNRRG